MREPATEAAGTFLEHVVTLFNGGVRSGDFSHYLELFADDAVLEFDGIPDPPLAGRDAIAQRYRDNPPDDQIRIKRSKLEGARIVAEFQWRDIPEASGGCFILERRGEKIAHLTIAFGGPATRCFR